MKSSYSELRNRTMCLARMFAVPTLFVALAVVVLSARANAATDSDTAVSAAPETYHSLYLTNATDQRDAADIVTDLRNMVPRARIFYVYSRNVISMMSTEHDYDVAKQAVAALSGGQRVFRLTYTFTGFDNEHGGVPRSVSVIVASGEHVSFKLGTKVPLVTGGNVTSTPPTNEQVQYLDLGLNIYADLSGTADDLRLHTKVEQSALVPDKPNAPSFDPVIRQIVLNDGTTLTIGEPLKLGSVDIPGTTKQEQIEVTAEPVK